MEPSPKMRTSSNMCTRLRQAAATSGAAPPAFDRQIELTYESIGERLRVDAGQPYRCRADGHLDPGAGRHRGGPAAIAGEHGVAGPRNDLERHRRVTAHHEGPGKKRMCTDR